jgi:hypothetical protein
MVGAQGLCADDGADTSATLIHLSRWTQTAGNRLRRVRPGNAFVVEEARLAPWSLAHLAPALHLPERKAAKARLNELMAEVQQTGAELKSVAPLLVDFPAELDGMSVLYCWLEGEPELAWYHRTDLGFAGRRRLP